MPACNIDLEPHLYTVQHHNVFDTQTQLSRNYTSAETNMYTSVHLCENLGLVTRKKRCKDIKVDRNLTTYKEKEF